MYHEISTYTFSSFVIHYACFIIENETEMWLDRLYNLYSNKSCIIPRPLCSTSKFHFNVLGTSTEV